MVNKSSFGRENKAKIYAHYFRKSFFTLVPQKHSLFQEFSRISALAFHSISITACVEEECAWNIPINNENVINKKSAERRRCGAESLLFRYRSSLQRNSGGRREPESREKSFEFRIYKHFMACAVFY
jgi:hypothetical protein